MELIASLQNEEATPKQVWKIIALNNEDHTTDPS
jgi:hypothetical protein